MTVVAQYSYADAQPYSMETLPEIDREVVAVDRDNSHRTLAAADVHRYISLYGRAETLRWAYAKPCACEVCTWQPPGAKP